jgi:hypothetical protein
MQESIHGTAPAVDQARTLQRLSLVTMNTLAPLPRAQKYWQQCEHLLAVWSQRDRLKGLIVKMMPQNTLRPATGALRPG